MNKADTLLQAGKQLAAVAAGRAFRGEPLKPDAHDILNDSAAQKQSDPVPPQRGPSGSAGTAGKPPAKEGGQDPGNPNAVNPDDQDPGQEKA